MAASSGMDRRIDSVFAFSDGKARRLARPGVLLVLAGLPVMCLAATVGLGSVGGREAPGVPANAAPPIEPSRQATREVSVLTLPRPRLIAPQVAAETAAAKSPAFEVASIRAHEFPPNVFGFSSTGRSFIRISGSRVTLSVVSLIGLVRDAYDVQDFQVSGAPGWTDQRGRQQFYDIEARAPGDGTPTVGQVRQMLQTLLADRFQLKASSRGERVSGVRSGGRQERAEV